MKKSLYSFGLIVCFLVFFISAIPFIIGFILFHKPMIFFSNKLKEGSGMGALVNNMKDGFVGGFKSTTGKKETMH